MEGPLGYGIFNHNDVNLKCSVSPSLKGGKVSHGDHRAGLISVNVARLGLPRRELS